MTKDNILSYLQTRSVAGGSSLYPKKTSNNHSNIHTVRTGGINEEAGEVDELFFIYSKISSSWHLTKTLTDGRPS